MQRKGPFPGLQLIFLQKPVWAMKMLPLESPDYCSLMPNLLRFFVALSAVETGERPEICCIAGVRHILLQHFCAAAGWLLSKLPVSLHTNLRGSDCSLALLSPKLCLGITLLKVKCWSCSFGEMRPREEGQQPLQLLDELSGF